MDKNLKIGDTVFFRNGLETRKGTILSLQERTCIDYAKSFLGIGYALLSLELKNKPITIREHE